MPKAKLYNTQGVQVGEIDLSGDIFAVKLNQDLLYQAVVTAQANQRQVLAHAKQRAEVRGGGRKPWRQKGTGRARHGSIRSPLWKGGGVTFGPTKQRNFKKKINKKMKRKALSMALTNRFEQDKLIILDNLEMKKFKTRQLKEILDKLPVKDKKTLLILPEKNQVIQKSANNLENLKVIIFNNINILDVLSCNYLLITQEAVKNLEKIFVKKAK